MWRVLFLILVLTISVVFAQTPEKPKAYLFDEFGKISQTELKKRTEKLKKKIQETAWSENYVSAYLIFYYDSKQKSSRNLDKVVRDILFDNCRDCFGFSPNIVFVNGGKAKEQKVQFWIVPVGAEPPNVSEDEKTELPKAAKFEEFGYVSNGNIRNYMDNFLLELVNKTDLQGYIFNYGKPKEIDRRERILRSHLRLRTFDPSRVTFVRGRNKKEFITELWLAPQGAEPPTP